MKKNILLLIMLSLFCAPAFSYALGGTEGGGGSSLSWRDILQNKNYIVSAPQIAFGAPAGFAGTTYVPVYATCVSGDLLKTTSALPIYKFQGSDSEIVQAGTAVLATNRSFLRDVNDSNDFTKQVSSSYSLNYMLDILDARNSDGQESNPVVLFKKEFTIPTCVR